MALINSDDSIGSFVPVSGAMFTQSNFGHTIAVVGASLYVMGGTVEGVGVTGSIERAPINPDGTLGAFAPAGNLTGAGVARSTSVVVGNSLYVVGGIFSQMFQPTTVASSVQRATINADGSIGAFAIVPNINLNTARFGHVSMVVGKYLYVIGGSDDTLTVISSIERAPIGADGSIGPFEAVSTSLHAARQVARGIVLGNALHVIGGDESNGTIVDSIEEAALQ